MCVEDSTERHDATFFGESRAPPTRQSIFLVENPTFPGLTFFARFDFWNTILVGLWRWMNLCRTNLWSFLSKNVLIGHRIILRGQWFRLATRIFFRLQLERKNVNWIFLPCMTSNYTKPFAQKNQRTMEWKFEGWMKNGASRWWNGLTEVCN